MEKVTIALLGLGTVGSGVVDILKTQREKLKKTTGKEFVIKKILVNNLHKKRRVDLTGISLTDQAQDILKDRKIDVVIEVMGTVDVAKAYLKEALVNHKDVITANKDLIAQAGPELELLAQKTGQKLYYEAAVAGGIPILRTLKTAYLADEITRIDGIVNGTSNFILTAMQADRLSYQAALNKAQELGFAESNPVNDVAGFDAAYKMVILTNQAFGTQLKATDVFTQGISQVDLEDILFAERMGLKLKLIGTTQKLGSQVAVAVMPTFLAADTRLAQVDNENNGLEIVSRNLGHMFFYGPGAGSLPTANSVVSDLVEIATNKNGLAKVQTPLAKMADNEIEQKYYLRLGSKNLADILAWLEKTVPFKVVSQTEKRLVVIGTWKQNEVKILTQTLGTKSNYFLARFLTEEK